jgi:hypothetical protein
MLFSEINLPISASCKIADLLALMVIIQLLDVCQILCDCLDIICWHICLRIVYLCLVDFIGLLLYFGQLQCNPYPANLEESSHFWFAAEWLQICFCC